MIPIEQVEKEIQAKMQEIADEAYKEGMKAAAKWLAVWRDGEQYVGVMRIPLHETLKDIDSQSAEVLRTRGGW